MSKIYVNPGAGSSSSGGVLPSALSGQPKQQNIDTIDRQVGMADNVNEVRVTARNKDVQGKSESDKVMTLSAKNEMPGLSGKSAKAGGSSKGISKSVNNSNEEKTKKNASKVDSVVDKRGTVSVSKNED